jgi:pyrimidine deaminase RibD-like protein
VDDDLTMQRAMNNAAAVRTSTSPNPWVGAVVVTDNGDCFDGADPRVR